LALFFNFSLAFLPFLPNERAPQEALKGEKLSRTECKKKVVKRKSHKMESAMRSKNNNNCERQKHDAQTKSAIF